MHFTGEISLGVILSAAGIILTLITIASRLGAKIGAMQTTAETQGESIDRHTKRLDLYEERLVQVVGEVQRMIGRMESTQDRIEKRTGMRHGEGNR